MRKLDSAAIVRVVREMAGLTQEELARRAGTSQPAVARYENGSAHPSTATLQRLTRTGGYELQVELVRANPCDLSTDRAKKLRRHRGEILAAMEREGARNVRIFGSVARGEDGEDGEDGEGSDIDLLVDFDLHRGLLPFVRLNFELSQLLDELVEVSPQGILKPNVLDNALADAVPL
jgi:predicted nucleotidyltransferase/DNA-binding XRE family transcriptional regulator